MKYFYLSFQMILKLVGKFKKRRQAIYILFMVLTFLTFALKTNIYKNINISICSDTVVIKATKNDLKNYFHLALPIEYE